MSYESFAQAENAAAAIQLFLRSATVEDMPLDMQDEAWKMVSYGYSTTFGVAHFAHLVYARHTEVSTRALALAASCAGFASLHAIDDMGNGYGNKIMQALRRRAGEVAPIGQAWLNEEDDPAAREQFVKQVEVVAEPELPEKVENVVNL